MTPPVVGYFRHAEVRAFPRITYNHAPGVPEGRALTVFLSEVPMWAWETATARAVPVLNREGEW